MTHDTGRFVWFEMLTDDEEAIKRFYLELLPWKVEAMPMPEGAYSMIKAGETPVAGFAPLPRPGVSPHWVAYLSVDDVDAAARAVVAAGGDTLMDPIDIPGVGRAQPVKDDQGAAFFLFRAAEGDPEPAAGPGAFHWNELWTPDPDKAARFFEKALGFSSRETEMPAGTYIVLTKGGKDRGGILRAPDAAAPTRWVPYVEVADADAALARAKRGGATLLGEPIEVPEVGRFGLVADPQGGTLGLIAPQR